MDIFRFTISVIRLFQYLSIAERTGGILGKNKVARMFSIHISNMT